MIKKLCYKCCRQNMVIQELIVNRCISSSATKYTKFLSKDISKRLFPDKLREESYTNEINVQRLTSLMDERSIKLKKSLSQFLLSKIMKPRYDISLKEERNLSHLRLNEICKAGFMSVNNFIEDPHSIFIAHELAAIVDPAMAFKMNIQFNWFAGTLLKLGTERNYGRLLENIDNLNAIGCFGLTELGHGNNFREMETTALYDPDTKEIIINTPNPLAQKYWVTNAAVHAKYMIVFAQLFVKGVHHGIHAILVRIRDDNLNIMKDVHIEDMGHKIGLNGMDTAKVSFDNVRVPQWNLLNKFCDITATGEYVSALKDVNLRIYIMSDELLSGRISTAAMCIGATKASLAIAIKYAVTRLGDGPKGKQDVPILQYQLQQKALIPLLARTYVLQFGLNYVKNRYCHQPKDGSHHRDIVTMTSAIKALSSWNLENVVKVCRERCGGQGFLSCNRFGTFLGLAYAAISSDGDNSVLMQKIVRERLRVFKSRDVTGVSKDFSSLDSLFELLNKKESLLFLELERKVYEFGKEKAFDLWILEESDLVQACGMAFAERLVSEYLTMVTSSIGKEEFILLSALHRLFILNICERDIGIFMKHGIIGPQDITDMEYESTKLCRYLSACALELVDAFAIPDEMLSAPVARDWIDFNAGDNKGEV